MEFCEAPVLVSAIARPTHVIRCDLHDVWHYRRHLFCHRSHANMKRSEYHIIYATATSTRRGSGIFLFISLCFFPSFSLLFSSYAGLLTFQRRCHERNIIFTLNFQPHHQQLNIAHLILNVAGSELVCVYLSNIHISFGR